MIFGDLAGVFPDFLFLPEWYQRNIRVMISKPSSCRPFDKACVENIDPGGNIF